jgi:UDPglucose 6-dehydrogenase
VICVDKVADKIARLQQGVIPIYEPGLDVLVQKNADEGRLRFTTDLAAAVPEAEAVFIAVGTPSSRRGDGYADLTYIYEAARELAVHLQGYTVVVDKSTVPVGTARQVERVIREASPQADFDVASNPEFLREGAAISDFMRPDRVVIGVDSDRAGRHPDRQHHHRNRGTDQVRGQRLSGRENQFHQRNRQRLRGGWRQRGGPGQGHRHGRPHRQ